MNEKLYVACYMPEGEGGPTKFGFKTEDEAWDYVYDNSCNSCKRLKAAGKSEYCSAEWLVSEMDETDHILWKELKK